MDGSFINHPEAYRLDPKGHRYHLILPPSQIPAGGLADELHDRASRMLTANLERHRPLVEALADPRLDPKKASRLIQYNEDAHGQVAALRRKYPGGLDPEAYVAGHHRIAAFLPVLAQHLLDGEHGQGKHAYHLKQALKGMKIEHLGLLHDNASFNRQLASGPDQGKHSLQFGGITVMAHQNAAKARDTGSDFYGAPHLLTPEMLVAHEMGHLLDFTLSNAQAKDDSRHHDPVIGHRHQPGLRMVQGFDWQHVHDGMAAYARDAGHPALTMPTLPQPFTRLHYPTHGGSAPHELPQRASYTSPNPVEKDLAYRRMGSVMEWPTTTTELAMADPSALGALDLLFGKDPKGRSAGQIVEDFWGFPWKPQADPQRTRLMANVLRETLTAGGAGRGFQPMTEAGHLLYPNPLKGDTSIRGYAQQLLGI